MGQKHIFHKQVSCKHCVLLSQGSMSWDIHGGTSELSQALRQPWLSPRAVIFSKPQFHLCMWTMVPYFPLWFFFAMQLIKNTEMKVHSHKPQHFYKTSISPFFIWLRAVGSDLLKSILSTWKRVVFLFANCLLCFLNCMNKSFHLTLSTEFMLF